jgi:hypothetical protein
MQRCVSGLCSLVSLLMAAPSYAFDRDAAYAFYQSWRPYFEEEFEKGVKHLSSRRSPTISDQEFTDAIDGLKLLQYNTAYIFVQCFQLAPNGASRNAFWNDCKNDRIRAFQRVWNRSTNLSNGSMARLAEACLEQARLLEAEDQFPPYDFFSGFGARLYNFKKVEDCLSGFDR